jgi:putative SOS response-associated peptidase YedK
MCGRYTLFSKKKKLEQRFGVCLPFELAPFYNAAPSQELPVILNDHTSEVKIAVWGFLPAWAGKDAQMTPMINVRSETIAEKPSFRDAFLKRRCLVPADGFYEWKKSGSQKTPHYIHLKEKGPFAFAGIWENRMDEKSGEIFQGFAILTTEANDMMASIHPRMPVILKPGMEKVWLSLAPLDAETLSEMTKPYAGNMHGYPVSAAVNSTANNSPDCIEKATPKELPKNLELFPSF